MINNTVLLLCVLVVCLVDYKYSMEILEVKAQLLEVREKEEMNSMGIYYTEMLQHRMHPEIMKYVRKLPMDYNGDCPKDGNRWYHREGDRACILLKYPEIK